MIRQKDMSAINLENARIIIDRYMKRETNIYIVIQIEMYLSHQVRNKQYNFGQKPCLNSHKP